MRVEKVGLASVSLPQIDNGLPENSLNLPLASATISAPASVSQGFSFNSQKPSNRPQDNYDLGDVLSAYTIKPLRETAESFKFVTPSTSG